MPVRKKLLKQNRSRLAILYFLGLLLAISSALPAYIQSNFLGQFVGVQYISLFFVIANFLSIIAILIFPSFIKSLTNYFLTKTVLAVYFASLLGLTLATGPVVALVSLILLTITANLIWINMDVLVESFSSNSTTGKTRTTYLTLINAGWIISPFLSACLISRGSYTLSFLIAAAVLIPFYGVFVYHGRKLKDKIKYQEEKLATTIKKMWLNKNLRGIFFVALLLQLFYSSAVIYIPFHLFHDLGLSWDSLGIMFSIMLVPFVLIEFPAGLIADRYIGEKEMLFVGFTILTIALFLFYYLNTGNFWLWTSVLFFSRMGAALVEAMRETYFFKIVDVEEVAYINVFRATTPLAYTLGPALAILILAFFPLPYLFLFFSFIMLSGFAFVASLKDTK